MSEWQSSPWDNPGVIEESTGDYAAGGGSNSASCAYRISWHAFYQVDAQGIDMVMEITAQKPAKKSLQGSNARVKLFSDIAARLLAADNPLTTIGEICAEVMVHLDCQAFFFYAVDPLSGRLFLHTCSGISSGAMQKIAGLDDAVCSIEDHNNSHFVVENVQFSTDPRIEIVKSYGLQTYACYPLHVKDCLLGTLSFGATTRTRFTADELVLMKTVANLVTIALAGMQVQQSLQKTTVDLAQSNKELAQFTYVASHDLQEPLRAVSGYVTLVEEQLRDHLDEKVQHYIDGAIRGAERMQQLITDLLAFSRVGTHGKAFMPVEFNSLLDQAIQGSSVSIHESNAQITYDPLPCLEVDAWQMVYFFQNLIDNAIKFRSNRPPRIHIGVELRDDCWQFSVRDNGIGIETEYFQRIFAIFQRLHTRTQYAGTGIGLALCQKIIERHGGAIWVESEPGQGTIFYFTIPKQRAHRHD